MNLPPPKYRASLRVDRWEVVLVEAIEPGASRRIALAVPSRVPARTGYIVVGAMAVGFLLSFIVLSATARVACLILEHRHQDRRRAEHSGRRFHRKAVRRQLRLHSAGQRAAEHDRLWHRYLRGPRFRAHGLGSGSIITNLPRCILRADFPEVRA